MTKFVFVNTVDENRASCIWDIPEHEVEATAYEFSRLNPNIKENINFWKKYVQENGYYALAIEFNEVEMSVEYCPLSKEAYEELVISSEKEGSGCKYTA